VAVAEGSQEVRQVDGQALRSPVGQPMVPLEEEAVQGSEEMILGPNDPRAITGKELEEARKNTEKWNDSLGIKPLTKKQQAAKDAKLKAILKIIEE
jgi:hypothetical protein